MSPPTGLVPRTVGPATIAVLVVVYTASWLVVGPPDGETWASHLGQLAGADAVLLMSIGLVLISTLPWVEELVRRHRPHRDLAPAGRHRRTGPAPPARPARHELRVQQLGSDAAV